MTNAHPQRPLLLCAMGLLSACSSDPIGEAFALERELGEQECQCFFDELDYSSPRACVAGVEAESKTPEARLWRSCSREAYDVWRSDLSPYIECLADELREYLRCADRVGCNEDALDACEELADRCPEPSTALDDVVGAYVEECVEQGLAEGRVRPDADPVGDEVRPASAGACFSDEFRGSGVVGFNTEGGGDSFRGSCGGNGEADVAFRWTPTETGSYVFEIAEASFDTILYVRADCDGVDLACDDDGGEGSRSRLELGAVAGQSYIIVVDAFSGEGSGALSVTRRF